MLFKVLFSDLVKHYPPDIYFFKPNNEKKYRKKLCNVFRMNNTDTRTTSRSGDLIVNFKQISHFFSVSVVDF